MIYQTVNFSMFCDAFRSLRPDNFSYEGLQALYNYLEDMADSTGEPMELDVIALCCEYQESSVDEVIESYGFPDSCSTQTVVDWLQDNTDFIDATGQGSLVFRSI